ncbi:MAG: TrmH family RNA methyltransferase [Deltaproteobacteria bacterium]|nr:TrmH family RNA methyltransferase [Deltaproteobacteria bacterium]
MRFPVLDQDDLGSVCPLCRASTRTVEGPYEEYDITNTEADTGNPAIEVLLDNIRSIYNVGAFFRTADGAGIRRIHLCGLTPTPSNRRLAKTALGAQDSVSWIYHRNGLNAAQSLKNDGLRLWALEGGRISIPLPTAAKDFSGPPIVLVVGNEISGVDPGILKLCDKIFHIPMNGIKTSLNAAVSFGIAVYALRFLKHY